MATQHPVVTEHQQVDTVKLRTHFEQIEDQEIRDMSLELLDLVEEDGFLDTVRASREVQALHEMADIAPGGTD
jgi:hypothetical protein